MQWVASTLHTTSEHGVSSITTAYGAYLGAASSRLNWRPPLADLNGLCPFCTKSVFYACAITFQLTSTDRTPYTIYVLRISHCEMCIWPCATGHGIDGRLQLKCDGTRWRTEGESEDGNWRTQWVASTLHTTSEHGVSSITTADGAHIGPFFRVWLLYLHTWFIHKF